MKVLVAMLVLLPGLAEAGSLYRCVNKDGVAAYQETPCEASAKGGKLGYIAPVKASPKLSWSGQRGEMQRQQQQRERLYQAEVPRIQPSQDGGDYASGKERSDAIAQLNSQIDGIGSLNSRGKREFAAELSAQRNALVSGNPPASPAPSYQPAPTYQPAPAPTTLVDQNGNRYQKPPGSAFVTDDKTGKQCFVNGAFIHC